MVPESGGFWPQAGNLRFPALTKDAFASFEPRSSVALLPVVSSRGTAARAGRGTGGPSRSSAPCADCPREPQAPSLLASPGERRSPELAAHSAANVRVRRECLALSVRQESVDRAAETGSPVGAYLKSPFQGTAVRDSYSRQYEVARREPQTAPRLYQRRRHSSSTNRSNSVRSISSHSAVLQSG